MHHRLPLLALALTLGCGPTQPPNIVLIVVDTLRADRLGAYGALRELTPEIDALARRGTVFLRAYAQTSWTSPSVASLMTSRYQLQHGVLAFDSVLPQSELTLAEVLGDQGYMTGGFTANTALRSGRGYSQGFEQYEWFRDTSQRNGLQVYARADRVNSEVLEWIDGRSGDPPIFLYVQYMEPHSPYRPSAEALERLRPGEDPLDLERVNNLWFLRYGKQPGARALKLMMDLYDAEIIDLDRQIGELVRALEERGLLDDSILVITSDQGEEFGDHGSRGHGATLFEEVVRVPLVIVRSDTAASARVDTVVELVDLAPTLLDLAGAPIPDAFEGHSLRPLLPRAGWLARLRERFSERDREPFRGPGLALSELHHPPFGDARLAPLRHRQSLIASDRKIAIRHGSGDPEFYDLRADPGEQRADALEADERRELRERFEAAAQRATSRPSDRLEKPLDAETRDNLRALGYIE